LLELLWQYYGKEFEHRIGYDLESRAPNLVLTTASVSIPLTSPISRREFQWWLEDADLPWRGFD